MTDDFTPLTGANHWLGWLGDDPAQAVREQIEGMLRQQVATAKVEWIRLLGKPYFLTGGRKASEDSSQIIVTRAALALAFDLEVRAEGAAGKEGDRVDSLAGVFSWVAVGLDTDNRRDRMHLDLDAELAWASDKLMSRIYELDRPDNEEQT